MMAKYVEFILSPKYRGQSWGVRKHGISKADALQKFKTSQRRMKTSRTTTTQGREGDGSSEKCKN